ncbi:MAG: hypothetical protein HY881_04355 [Deltaproteobacteria bacterium]|nr:hypothetical protein [Deltaproteobacteria bacterium]
MNETFYTRIPTLSNSELLGYIHNSSKYKFEAIEAAVIELRKRGVNISNEELLSIQESLYQKKIAKNFLDFPPNRIIDKIGISFYNLLSVIILAIGLGSSIIIYLTAEPTPLNPLGYDPLNTKKYLRELEVYGGKMNVLATEFMQWFDGLWHGRSLAFTVGIVSTVLAFLVWFIGIHLQTNLDTESQYEADHKDIGS